MIITRTPLRISLCGGGTDIPEFYEKSPGAVISFAISKVIYVMVNGKFDGRIRLSYSNTENVDKVEEVKHSLFQRALEAFRVKGGLEIASIADIPGEGSGLGSSSSFMVGLANALGHHFHNNTPRRGGLAEFAYDIESKSNPEIGKQDHYAAACGGLNLFRFNKKSVTIKPVDASDCQLFNFEEHLLLLWTGITRPSGVPLKAQKEKFSQDSGMKIGIEMAALANELYRQMEVDNFHMVGDYLHENWLLKKSISKSVSSDQIDAWYDTARENGASGGKLCGAGGGGFMLFYCDPDARDRIARATGLRRIDFKIETRGSDVIYEA